MKNYFILGLLAIIALFGSCKQDETTTTTRDDFEKNTKLVASNIVIETADENQFPLASVDLEIDNIHYISNAEGLIFLKNVKIKSTGHLVKLSHPKFMTTLKRIYPEDPIVKLHLLARPVQVNFNASNTNTVSSDGIQYTFPAGSVVNENGSAYSGSVYLAARRINPASALFSIQAPADLRAIDKDNNRVVLSSYGMVATEIYDPSGNRLKIADGKKVKIVMPIDAKLTSAPNQIPIWSLEDQKPTGVWEEEGVAIKINNNYEFEVSHFSFWNCDVPANYIELKGRTVNTSGSPLNGITVTVEAQGAGAGYDYTNSEGKFGGKVPSGVPLKIKFSTICGSSTGLIHKEIDLGILNNDTDLGDIQIVLSTQNQKTFLGTVEACSPNVLGATYVKITTKSNVYYIPIPQSGTFSSTIECYELGNATFKAVDYINGTESPSANFNILNYDQFSLPGFIVCNTVDEYITVKFNNEQEYFYGSDPNSYLVDSAFSNTHSFYLNGTGLNANLIFDFTSVGSIISFSYFSLFGTLKGGQMVSYDCQNCSNGTIIFSQFDYPTLGGYMIGTYAVIDGLNTYSGKVRLKVR